MKLGIEGKRALVTEGDAGVGKSIARTLAGEGAHLIIHGRDRRMVERTVVAIIGDGGSAEAVAGDLSTPDGAAQVVATVLSRGGIDILVNNACMPDAGWSDWLSLPDEHWEKCFLSNVMSAVRMIRAFVPVMSQNGWGRIINVSNANAMAPTSTTADYQASGAALVNLTLSLARSLAGSGVTANVISPGPMLSSELLPGAEMAPRPNGEKEAHKAQTGDHRHNGRAGIGTRNAAEFSAAAALLASRLADYTTGTNLHIGVGEA